MVSATPVILLVEDECIIRTALAGELMAAGWTVLEVSTGEAAMALFRDDPPLETRVHASHCTRPAVVLAVSVLASKKRTPVGSAKGPPSP